MRNALRMALGERAFERALQQEVQLRRQRPSAGVAVEALEEWILGCLLEHRLRGKTAAQPARETRLTDPDRALDDDVLVGRFARHAITTDSGPRT